MEGNGHISDWLHNTGREIGKAVGSELKGAARDKAVSYAQEMLGRGIADELGMAAQSVGRTALGSAASQIGNVRDTDSAKRAAASVGRAAASEGASQLAGLAGKYFGGAGTPEQAVKACAYTLASLRKIVTAYRRDLSKMSVNDFLAAHVERALASRIVKFSKKKDSAQQMNEFVEGIYEAPKDGGYSMAEKRKLVSRIRKALHPPVSSMNRNQIVQYIYGTALEQNVVWEPYFEAAIERAQGLLSHDWPWDRRVHGAGTQGQAGAICVQQVCARAHADVFSFHRGPHRRVKWRKLGTCGSWRKRASQMRGITRRSPRRTVLKVPSDARPSARCRRKARSRSGAMTTTLS